jgi:putative membrane protein
MMDHWGGGWIMWLLIVAIIVLVVYLLVRGSWSGGPGPTPHETALDILKKRYARGEITKEQFDEMKKDL